MSFGPDPGSIFRSRDLVPAQSYYCLHFSLLVALCLLITANFMLSLVLGHLILFMNEHFILLRDIRCVLLTTGNLTHVNWLE